MTNTNTTPEGEPTPESTPDTKVCAHCEVEGPREEVHQVVFNFQGFHKACLKTARKELRAHIDAEIMSFIANTYKRHTKWNTAEPRVTASLLAGYFKQARRQGIFEWMNYPQMEGQVNGSLKRLIKAGKLESSMGPSEFGHRRGARMYEPADYYKG